MAEDSEEDVWFDLVSVQMAVWWIIEVIHHTHTSGHTLAVWKTYCSTASQSGNSKCLVHSEQFDDVGTSTAGKNVIAKNYIGMGTSAIQRRLMFIMKFPIVILFFLAL